MNKKTIGVIGAMKKEMDALQAMIPDAKTEVIGGIEFVTGSLFNVDLIAARSGVGKVFAAMCAQTMILNYHPDCILNMGVGGAISGHLDIADVAIADRVAQHDMDTRAAGDPWGLISGINVIYLPCDEELTARLKACAKKLGVHYERGVIASGDCFVNSRAQKESIRDYFSAIACEMEGGAIGQVCYVNNVPFAAFRAISDSGDENAENDYAVSAEKASAVSMKLTEAFLHTFD